MIGTDDSDQEPLHTVSTKIPSLRESWWSQAFRIAWPAGVLIILIASVVWFLLAGPKEKTSIQISRLSEGVVDLVVFAAVMGVAGMALVEMGKRMLLLRGAYHQASLRRLFGPDVINALVDPWQFSPRTVDGPVKTVAVDNEVRRRLDVPLEQLSAQLAEVAEALLLRLTVRHVESSASPGSPSPSVVADAHMARHLFGPRGATLLKELEKAGPEQADLIVTELRALMFAALDRFQVVVGGNWRARIQLAAACTTSFLTIPAVLLLDVGTATKLAAVCLAFFVGGVASWISRDVAALLERLRNR